MREREREIPIRVSYPFEKQTKPLPLKPLSFVFRLLDKLLVGRERGIELSGAIASNQRMMAYGMSPGIPGALMPLQMPMGGQPAGKAGKGSKTPTKANAIAMQAQGPWMQDRNGLGSPTGGNKMRLPPLQAMGSPGGQIPASYAGGEPWSPGHMQQPQHYNSDGEYGTRGGLDNGALSKSTNYAHVTSKYAQSAAEATMAGRGARSAKGGRNSKAKPDRFEEANREANRVASMANW